MNTLEDIKKKNLMGDTKKALVWLIEWTKTNRRSSLQLVEACYADYNKAILSFIGKEVTREQHEIALTRITKQVFQLVDTFSKPIDYAEKEEQQVVLATYNKYNCDRVVQNDAFFEHYEKIKTKPVNFFFLKGEETESHFGFVHKIAYYQAGHLLSLQDEDGITKQLLIDEIYLEPTTRYDIAQKDLIRKLMAAFELSPDEHAEILEKNLEFVCEQSPRCAQLSSSDYICLHIKIEEDHWLDLDIPKLLEWFTNQFCQLPADENRPFIYVFFGMLYYEDGDDEVRLEVENTMKSASYLSLLPELKSVVKRDVQRWFRNYKSFFNYTKDERKEVLDQFFDGKEELDMETVENLLHRLIKAHNEKII